MPSLIGLRTIFAFDNWPTLLLDRVINRRAGLLIYHKNGCEVLIDHKGGDCAGTRACIAGDMYSRYLPSLDLPKAVNVLDLGANGGGFILMLRIAGVAICRSVSVEMNPVTFQRLAVNLATNVGAAAVTINGAVCAMPVGSEILLKPSRGDTGESIYSDRAGEEQPHVAVKTTTIEALCAEYFAGQPIDLCKIDIEGAEYEALGACPDRVLAGFRHLIIEFHDAKQTPAVLARLSGLGFAEVVASNRHETSATTELRVFRGPAAGGGAVKAEARMAMAR